MNLSLFQQILHDLAGIFKIVHVAGVEIIMFSGDKGLKKKNKEICK